MILKQLGRAIVKATEHTVVTHDGIEHAGYLSFLGLLSFFPFLVFLVALAGFVGEGELGRQFIGFVRDALPEDAAAALLPRIDEIISGPSPGLLTVSMLAALWTASSAVEGYRTVLNRAYHVGTPPAYVWRRLLSIVQLLLFSILVLVGMLVLVLAPVVLEWLAGNLIHRTIDLSWLYWDQWARALSAAIIFTVIFLMYYVIPNAKQDLFSVLPGTLFTLAFWLLSMVGFRYYLSSFDQVNLIYGSLGGVIAALLFFYILNVIFIFGAELNYQLMRAFGERVEEKERTSEGVEKDER